ncbi:MAG: hypothetical protein ACI31N_00560 [Lacticaseibacillus absianus]
MTSRKRRALEAFLKEDAQTGVSSGDLQTAFVKKRKFLFVTYQEQGGGFTWNNNVKEPYQSRNPVVYLAVPENMTYVEIGGFFSFSGCWLCLLLHFFIKPGFIML